MPTLNKGLPMTLATFSRRDFIKYSAAGFAGISMSGWLEALAAKAAGNTGRKKSCILLWMSGGPSQMDTFDCKVGHANGGTVKEIETAVPGIKISEHLPTLAKQMKDVSLIRGMSTKEGDHSRGTFLMRTGYLPQGPIHYPTLGSLVSKELGGENAELPGFVSISPYRFLSPAAFGSGFLGPRYMPLVVGNGADFRVVAQNGDDNYERYLKVQNFDRAKAVTEEEFDSRLDLLATELGGVQP